jgi:threonine/homoserine/homoserine lactone efflux protein
MVMTFIVFVIYGLLAHGFRRSVMESTRVQAWLKKGFATIFAGLGVELAMTQK